MARGILARAAAKAAKEAAEFNDRYPVGTKVRYWPGLREGEGIEGHTRSIAWEVCGTAVVKCTGRAGGIALSHVEPVPEDDHAA